MYTSSEFYLLKAGLVMAYVLPRMSYLSYRLITAAFFLSNLAYLIKFDCETIYKGNQSVLRTFFISSDRAGLVVAK